ncbi:hypothetical protein AKJ09_08957 [Labilithrix luteola]|uniref:DUF4177 domain-containing protein n=1 Tax=Labilithrix luteola TaxID=1391654 RepID=A0A0K1Q985_9BACT|nr:hypothetical protein [Labilithrix luteola]AKV02294.1 hypothetical protein AKJ09_08957 [Labilithrix luteola]
MSAFREVGVRSNRPAWEYKLVSFFVGNLQEASDRLNALGVQGWDVVGVVTGDSSTLVYTLKRLRDEMHLS